MSLHGNECAGVNSGRDTVTTVRKSCHVIKEVRKTICRNCGYVTKKTVIITEVRECFECHPSPHNAEIETYVQGNPEQHWN
jgi:hypothetical protein